MNVCPRVSVIIVNLNGRSLLGECLDALLAQDYPAEQVEFILVDNGSTDDSVAFMREAYPSVRVIEAGRNLGFAGGNNLGARHATGDYLALINNDARAAPDWLGAMVEELEGQTETVCASAKILDQQGRTIDFVGSVMNLYGRAFQIDEGTPADPGFYDEPRELLAPCGGAMMIRSDAFWHVEGFDEDYVAYYEDLDLGWRLWLYGYKVLFVPRAVVYHRQHRTGEGFPVEQRYVLSEANALRTVIKNYEDENLWHVLPLGLFLAVKRSLDQAQLDREMYALGFPRAGEAQTGVTEPEPKMTRVAMSFLVAVDQVADEMPHLMHKRRRVQSARVRSDEEIFTRFPVRPDNWLFPWRRYHVIQDQLAKEFDVPQFLQPRHGSRLLVITHEIIGPRMTGPGIRAWEMACALAEQFDMTLAAPGNPARSHPHLRIVGYETDDPCYTSLDPYIAGADVILAWSSLFARLPRLRELNKPAIVDLQPYELEKLSQYLAVEEQHRVAIDVESMIQLRLEGAVGDFFICASERQRDFWLGSLLTSGRINAVTAAQDPTLRSLIDVVPFGLPSDPPVRQRPTLRGVYPGINPDDKVLYWNGGLWQWLDPLTLIDALIEVLRVRGDVKLFFAGGRHFDPHQVPEMPMYAQAVERCRELDLIDRHVFFSDWIPYDERGSYLLEADLGVSIHQPSLESHFAWRTRLLDYIWAGLPVIATAGDPTADLIVDHGLGRTIPPGRPDLLAEAILSMLADDGLRDRVTKNSQSVRAELTWSRVVDPIARFLNRAAFAPDALIASRTAAEARRMITVVQERDQLKSTVETLLEHLEEIRQGRVMRVLNRLDSWRSRLAGRQ